MDRFHHTLIIRKLLFTDDIAKITDAESASEEGFFATSSNLFLGTQT